MIRVLLVDDEFLVCSFLRQLIDWEALGFHIVGQAGNGKQALELIRDKEPELIFLDVSMPEMDGIDLIRLLQKEHPQIRVVMLSSYSDYEYVRETMKLGAQDYLLKHQLTAENLTTLLKNLPIVKVQESKVEPEEVSFHLLRDSRTRSFFEGRAKEVPAPLERMGELIPAVAELRILHSSQSRETPLQDGYLIHRILTTCVDVCCQRQEVKVIFLGGSSLVFLFGARPGETGEQWGVRVERTMGVVSDALVKYHNTYLDWERGERCAPELLPAEWTRLKAQLGSDGQSRPASFSNRLTLEQERKIILTVLGKDRKGLLQLLDGLLQVELLREELSLLMGDLLSLSVKLYQENRVPYPEQSQPESLTNEGCKRYFTELLVGLVDRMNHREQYSKTVSRALDFVEEHHQQEIGISEIAGACGVNPSYLSSLFKKETGIGLIQYINRLRVYAAGKQMLMDGTTPTQVFEQVGFRNYNNFFNLFKEITGMAPKQFQEQATVEWIASFYPLKKDNK